MCSPPAGPQTVRQAPSMVGHPSHHVPACGSLSQRRVGPRPSSGLSFPEPRPTAHLPNPLLQRKGRLVAQQRRPRDNSIVWRQRTSVFPPGWRQVLQDPPVCGAGCLRPLSWLQMATSSLCSSPLCIGFIPKSGSKTAATVRSGAPRRETKEYLYDNLLGTRRSFPICLICLPRPRTVSQWPEWGHTSSVEPIISKGRD